ncbi:chemotaxis protein CheD [Leisingera sp. ANG-Vp]|uniref:chemotaxis protein CheD n=1 Tax=Leisingera sp. ANG-Vp TaxID=1577896 RepID=UPI00057E1687|nr:chemotaxis protein CheD [Leisingera sp. ANG-Vp]KIC19833.1 chemotaxis protein CheD [Leisingera sp. ANG-Vp]
MRVNANEKIHVQIGEVKTGRAGQSLNAILGSCIGLGLLYPAKGIYGLAHCLLSQSGKVGNEISGRHVDQAITSLQSLMDIPRGEVRKLQAIVVGGANMTMPPDTDPSRLVGSINARFAYKALREAGLRNIYEDVGGMQGRQVTIDCSSGEFSVADIPRLGASK